MLHKTGNKYKTRNNLIGIMTTFLMGKNSYCMLTTLGDEKDLSYRGYDGNRYKDPVKVEDPYNLSENELNLILDKDWEIYTSPIII